jgi:hypothetical protein
MGPNDAEVSRVYARCVGAAVSANTYHTNTNLEVVVETEYGAAIGGIPSKVGVTVIDLTAMNVIVTFPPINFAAVPGVRQDVFTVTAAQLAGREDHVFLARTFLSLGIVVEPDASVDTSREYLLI